MQSLSFYSCFVSNKHYSSTFKSILLCWCDQGNHNLFKVPWISVLLLNLVVYIMIVLNLPYCMHAKSIVHINILYLRKSFHWIKSFFSKFPSLYRGNATLFLVNPAKFSLIFSGTFIYCLSPQDILSSRLLNFHPPVGPSLRPSPLAVSEMELLQIFNWTLRSRSNNTGKKYYTEWELMKFCQQCCRVGWNFGFLFL